MKIDTGDTLYEPMSRNTGEVISVIDHPDGKIIKIRWRLDGQLPHDTELFYKKVWLWWFLRWKYISSNYPLPKSSIWFESIPK